jgi:TolA-binding protein
MTTLNGDERLKAIDALAKLDMAKVSPFAQRALQDRAAILRKEIGAGMFARGLSAYRHSEWVTAADEFSRFLALQPPDDEANEATYALAYSLFQLHRNDAALPILQKYVAGDKKLKNRDYAMVMLVQVYDAIKQTDKAVEISKQALADYPDSQFAGLFRARLKRAQESAQAGQPATQSADAPVQKPLTPQNVPQQPSPTNAPATKP